MSGYSFYCSRCKFSHPGECSENASARPEARKDEDPWKVVVVVGPPVAHHRPVTIPNLGPAAANLPQVPTGYPAIGSVWNLEQNYGSRWFPLGSEYVVQSINIVAREVEVLEKTSGGVYWIGVDTWSDPNGWDATARYGQYRIRSLGQVPAAAQVSTYTLHPAATP